MLSSFVTKAKTMLKNKVFLGAASGLVVVALVFLFLRVNPEEVDPIVGYANWSLGVKRDTALGIYRVWTSCDFKGGDLAFLQSKSLEECLYACDENPECLYVSYLDGICYLKDTPTRFERFGNRPSLLTAKRSVIKSIVADQWHDGKVQTTAISTYRVWSGRVFEGEALSTSSQPTMDLCLRSCDLNNDCMYISYDGSECTILKDSKKHTQVKAGQQSSSAVRVKRETSPDPLIKHHWTKGGPRETEDNVYQTWASCQFVGADIIAVKATSLDDCLKQCDAELFCRHVNLIGTECMLKGYGVTSFDMVSDKSDMWTAKRVASKRKPSKTSVLGSKKKIGEIGDLHDDVLIGYAYDEGYEQDTKVYRYRVWQRFDFWGGDLKPTPEKLVTYTLDSCLAACDEKPECQFAVVIVGKECWLKGAPYQLTRLVDDRADVYAMMKLGRIGKKGLDSNTLQLVNRMKPIEGDDDDEPNFGSGVDARAEDVTEPASSLSSSHLYGAGVLLTIGSAGVWLYLKKLNDKYYVNELN